MGKGQFEQIPKTPKPRVKFEEAQFKDRYRYVYN